MDKSNLVEVEDVTTNELLVFQSEVDDNEIHIARSECLAHIIKFDKETYNDINIETVIKACEIAGLISFKKRKEKKAGKKAPKWELDKEKS